MKGRVFRPLSRRFSTRAHAFHAGYDSQMVTLSDAALLSSISPSRFPGVYAYLRDGQPLYIGQSCDVRRRLAQHARDKRKKWPAAATHIRAIVEADYEARLVAETILILQHRPRYNQSIKIGIAANGRLRELQFLRSQ